MPLIPFADISNDAIPESLLNTIRAGRGDDIPTVYRLLLHSPSMLEGWVHLSNEVRFNSRLEAPLRESLILLVAHLTGCDYEWNHHRPLALAAGVAEPAIAGIRGWPELAGVPAEHRAYLEFAGALITRSPVADLDLAPWLRTADPQLVIEAAMTTSYYLGLAHLILALDLRE
jgi:alkylhydroperoxidase family enzyme